MEAGQSAAGLYAKALREALTVFTTAGGTQKDIARALNVAPATLSRYLSGERVAPRDVLRALRAYLDQRDMPWTPEVYENLDALCGQAHAASGSPAVQLVQLREELARLRGEQKQAQQVAEERLTGLETRAGRLAEQLEEALTRAQTAEARVAEQDESLRHAQDYIHQAEAELAQQREQARQLQQEVGVLREQNRRLVEEQQRVPGASTQDTSFEATLAAHRNRQERIAQEEARIARERTRADLGDDSRNHRQSHKEFGRFTAPPPRPTATTARYTPVRDTLTALTLTAAICAVGTAFAAGLQASPGPSIWKLVLAAAVGLFVSTMCYGYTFGLAEKYVANRWAPDALEGAAGISGPLLLPASLVTPFILDTDILGHWLADIVGLL
ncbi:helix-turn-helix domain-containing protein [Streptomyces sp. NPDC048357]|uniref:helix-turn-helix domain-containing protein n=1 Tax=Streptomyces sp. NPDC048357 TaxID=3154719 RepID=UPI00341C39E1